MKMFYWWLAIIASTAIAAFADAVGTSWAQNGAKFSFQFWLLLLLGPLVFFSFGLVATRVGLAVASGVVNSLIVITSIAIGLFVFGEWNKLSMLQYMGIIFAVTGIVLMIFFPAKQA